MNITFVSCRIFWKGYLVYQIFCEEHPEAGLWVHPDNQMFAGGEITSIKLAQILPSKWENRHQSSTTVAQAYSSQLDCETHGCTSLFLRYVKEKELRAVKSKPQIICYQSQFFMTLCWFIPLSYLHTKSIHNHCGWISCLSLGSF